MPDVHHEATFYRLDENHCLVLWLMQPDGMYWMDDDGFGIEDDSSIEMYGIVDNEGYFSNQCDILSPPTLKLRGGSFLFKQSNDYSIYKLSPCVPRFFYIFSYCICASLNPSCSILRLAL